MATMTKTTFNQPRVMRLLALALLALGILTLIGYGGFQIWRTQRMAQARAALQAAPQPGVSTMDMIDTAYAAPNILVTPGATVTWTNRDADEHDVIFLNGTPGSPLLNQDQTFQHTFTTPGTYEYVCSRHASMLGQVVVAER